MKHLVTGATGFIGCHLVRALAEAGDEVRALVLPGEPRDHIEAHVDEFVEGDITRTDTLEGIGDDVDVVHHLAARVVDWGRREQFHGSIVRGTQNVLDACAGRSRRFVYVSSFCALGVGRHLEGLDEDAPLNRSGTPYDDAKADAEALVKGRSDAFEDGIVIARPSNVIGPGSVWVQEVLEHFRSGLMLLIDGGRHSASLVSVDNLVDGLVLAGRHPAAANRTFHFRDDWEVTWERYLTDLSALIGKKPRGSLPFNLAWALGSMVEPVYGLLGRRPPVTRQAAALMGRNNDVVTTAARDDLGWTTRVSYDRAMGNIADWVREEWGEQP